jgi:hypothetical protein
MEVTVANAMAMAENTSCLVVIWAVFVPEVRRYTASAMPTRIRMAAMMIKMPVVVSATALSSHTSVGVAKKLFIKKSSFVCARRDSIAFRKTMQNRRGK